MSDGGGGGSYADLPDYIKYAHMDMIHGTTDDTQIDYLFALGDSLWWKTNLALDSRSYIEKNPYEMFDIPDPDGRLANLIYSIDHLKANIVPEVSVGSDITSHLNQARTDILNNFVGAFDDNLSGKLDTIISGAVTKAQTLLNTMAPEALTNVKSVGNDVRASAHQDMRNSALQIIDDAISSPSLDLDNITKTSITEVMETAMARSLTSINNLVNAAITKAAEVTGNAIIAAMVTAYEASTNTQFLRGVGRRAVENAGAGAANSSAHKIGLALLESDRAKDVNQYEAQLKLQVFQSVLDLYANKGDAQVGTFMQAYTAEYGLRLQEFQVKFTELVKSFLTIYSNYISNFGTVLNAAVSTGVDLDKILAGGTFDMFKLDMHVKNTSMLGYLQNRLDGEKTKTQLEFQVERHLADVERMILISQREFFQDRTTIEKLKRGYNFEIFQKAANVLAAPIGGVVNAAEGVGKPSELGGTLSGAVVGAEVGSYTGSGYGTAVGAIVGGIAGYLSSQ